MKKSFVKRLLASALVAVMAIGCLAGCGAKDEAPAGNDAQTEAGAETETDAEAGTDAETPAPVASGTIMWLSNLSSGIQYEAIKAYAESLCAAWGYELQIVYGDMMNDPAGNLSAVKNAMTDDVVGIIASQDGGLKDIMTEYPELYVVGFNTDMNSVYSADPAVATNADVASNPNFLGTVADGHIDGADLGKQMFDMVVAKGYKKVSTVIFPVYAYPNLTAGDASFRAAVEEYNATAADADKITIVGDAKVLEFMPLEDAYFLEADHQDLDCVVALCAGVDFVYPALKNAVTSGTCSADTKMITSGFNDDESIIADIGGEGIIQAITISPAENIGWAITMLDKAVKGAMYSDYTASERFDSLEYVMDTAEDVANVMSKSLNGTADASLAQISAEELQAAATYADLKALFMADQLTVDALANR